METVTIWVDPSCPWAWQTARWLVELESRGLLALRWRVFSLELNSAHDGLPPTESFPRQRSSLSSLLLARRELGEPGFRALYLRIGARLHHTRTEMSAELLRMAASDAGVLGIDERAAGDPDLLNEVVLEYEDARSLDVFGVPTIRIGNSKVMYGPILSIAPSDRDAIEMWEHVRWLIERPEVFELKRWPRDLRPGRAPNSDDAPPAGA